MRVAFDSVILGAYLHPDAAYPKPVARVRERLKHFVATLEAARATIILPTPALSEFLVLAAGDTGAYLAELTDSAVFVVEPFDLKAAIEAAVSQRRAIAAGSKRSGAAGSWQKVKVDRQIVAIAKVHGVDDLYSDDDDVSRIAQADSVPVKGVADLPLPPEDPQPPLFSDQEPDSS